MKAHVKIAACLITAAFSLVPDAGASVISEMHPLQIQHLRNGEQVMLLEDLDGKPWPRFKIYQVISATPEQVAAVFFDYNDAKSYIPSVMKSVISKRLSPCISEVDYGVSMPILPSEYYTARNTLVATGDNSYRVEWKLLRALQTKAGEGSLRIEPFDGKSLICYTNLVTPGSSVARLLKFAAISQMSHTVQAIVNQVEKVKTTEPGELERDVAAMRTALKEEQSPPVASPTASSSPIAIATAAASASPAPAK